jgi:hypothetical protein
MQLMAPCFCHCAAVHRSPVSGSALDARKQLPIDERREAHNPAPDGGRVAAVGQEMPRQQQRDVLRASA